ncbi:MAG TPA: hypothetical protein PKX92_00220 [Edaphocola sp.]|nr:hypothetical protein [Edaphocola sp.]
MRKILPISFFLSASFLTASAQSQTHTEELHDRVYPWAKLRDITPERSYTFAFAQQAWCE